MRGEDYADSSLEKPIDIFKRLSDDEILVTELQQFKKERNFLSHRAIMHCLDGEGSLSHSTALELQGRVEAIQREAQRLRQAIFDKARILALM